MQPAELNVERWFGNEKVVICRAGHPLGGASTLAELVRASWVTVAASDLFGMLPQQWLDIVASTPTVERILVSRPCPRQSICCARRAALPLTPAAERLCDLLRRAAMNHARIIAGGPGPDIA